MMNKLILVLNAEGIGPDKRRTIYHEMVHIMTYSFDWDTEDECVGIDPEYDTVFQDILGDGDGQ